MFIRQIIGIVRSSKKSFRLRTTLFWSAISTLLQLVSLRPRVYYTLTNFKGGGGARPPCPSPSIRQWVYTRLIFCCWYFGLLTVNPKIHKYSM